MKKIVRQCTALVLALVLLFCDCTACFGAEISSEEVPAFTGGTLEETSMPAEETDAGTEEFMGEAEAPRVLFEMEELRETSAKQFRLSDGTILAAQYGMDVHYEAENGSLKEIDNRFLYETAETAEDFAGYRTAEGAVEYKFAPQSGEGEILKLSEGGYSVGFELIVLQEEKLENEHSQMKEHEEVAVISELSMIPEDIVNLVVTETPIITSVPVITQIPDATEESEPVASQNAPLVFLKGEVLNTEEIPHTMELVTTAEGLVTVEMAGAETSVTASVEEAVLAENGKSTILENEEAVEEIPVVWAEVESAAPESEDAERLEAMKVENAVTSVGYGNVLPGVSLQYILTGSSLKEYILVNEKQEDYTYDFAMNLENLIPVLQEDGSILLLDAETEEAVYEIPAAFMTDAAGAYSDAVTMEIAEISEADSLYESEEISKNEWVLRITADKKWIDSGERKFPVQIDPTISQVMDSSSRMNAGYVTKEHPVESHTFSPNITVGYSPQEMEYQSYVQFKNLPQLPKNSVVCAAAFNTILGAYSHQSFSSINVKARKITGNNAWGTKYTWRSMPELSELIMDYRRIDDDLVGYYVGWNITELVKEHYQAGNTNSVVSGFVLQADEADEMDGDDWANAFLCTGIENIYPQMYIIYRDTKGVEGYYTYQSHGLGNAGTAYLGDYNGQLTLIKPLASYESTILPYTLSLVYNSSFADKNFTNDGKNLHTEDFSKARTGPGWKLSAQETVVEVQLKEGEESKSWLIWNDSDGTEHYFKLKDGSTTVYEDEDGLNLTITKAENGIDFTMKDKKDNQKFFKGGYLQKITDANGNIIHIVYNYGTAGNNQIDGAKSNPITSIWVQPKGGTAERILKLSYNDSGYMNLVEETYGTKTRIGYGMGTDGHSYPEIIYRYNEGTSAFVQMASYEYNTEDLLSVIQDVETKRGITYGYAKSPTGYRLVSWVELANGIAGHRASISSDEIRKTVYRDYGADRTSKTDDDILTTYVFNSSGHSINVYSEDSDGELLGVTAEAYQEKSGTSKKNNSLSNSIAGGQAGVNLLINGSFEKYGSDSAAASGWNKSGTGSAARRTTGPRSGNAHYNMYNASASGSAVIAKTVNLTAGKTYTASAYVNTTGAESFASDGGAFLKVLNSSGSQIALGNLLTYWTDTNIDKGWQRISVTFTPTGNGNHQLCVQWKNAKGTLRVDDVQLEMEEAASSYNHVYNPSFENGADGWTLSTTGKESVGTADTVHGSQAFKASGYPGVSVVAQQTIPLEKSSDTTFLLSAWSKGNSLPELEKSPWDSTKRYWGIRVTLNYSDQSIETHDLLFNEFVHQWQYASMAVAPKKDDLIIRNVAVQIFYNSNANSAVFDCISLTEEPCQTYTYDDEGNVVSVKSTGNGKENYSYKTGTQDLLSVGTAGSGTYSYEYKTSGNKHLPVKVTNDTVSMAIEYDSYGQSTKTTLTSSKDSTAKMQSTAVYSDGLLTKQTDNAKTETVYGYNPDREHIYTTYANGQTIESYKDPVYERLDRTYQAGWASASYGYTNGNLTGITRSGYPGYGGTVKYNQIYGFSYDSFGNRTGVTVKGEKRNPSDNALLSESSTKTIATYSYNSGNGTLSKMTYGPSTSGLASIDYTYDKLDRVSSVTYTNASPQKSTTYGYRYSSDGALAGITVDGTLKYTYEYDSLGRLIYSTKLSGNRPTLYTNHRYDTSDRITRQSWMVDGTGYEELYTYNTADGSLSSMKVNGEELAFSYNALKQLSKRTSPKLDVEYAYGTTGDGFTTNQVTAIRYRKHGETTYRLPRLDYTYDEIGNIKTVTPLDKATVTYEYDTQNKLRKETKGTTVEGIYDIDTYGNIRSKQWKDSEGIRNYTFTYGTGGNNDAWMDRIKTVTFDNGSGTPVTKTLSYDVLGNPTKYYNGVGEWDFTWQYGRQLATAKKTGTNTTITNTYDVDGIRDSKTVGSVKHTYTTLSGKIIREKYGTTTIDYLYDNEGRPYKLILNLNGTKIHGYFALNLQDDVIAIIDSTGEVAVTYEYDAWGREIASSTAGDYGSRLYAENRLKYRGYYYDSETGFYYVSSRYYDPEVGRFISADGQIAGVGGEISGYNLYSYCQNNPVNMSDPDGNWPKWATKVAIGVAVIAATAVVTVATAGAASGTLVAAVHCFAVGALKGAIIGGAVGAAVGGTTAAVKHRAKTGSWKGAGTAARDGAADGFMSGSIGGAISGGMTSNVCFVAGTSVLTVLGYTAIENISPGDKVWSENPETGEKELKEVVQTFVNETDELVHVHVNGEEIITTPEHPFYVPKKGWVGAIDLRAGDILVLQSGEYVVVELIQHEILESPVTVYNFEVEDFHTYYVSDSAVLVHNMCKPDSPVKVSQNALKKIDVHAFKKEFVKNNVSRWDVFKDTANNSVLWLGDKAQKVWHETGMYMEDLIDIFPKR